MSSCLWMLDGDEPRRPQHVHGGPRQTSGPVRSSPPSARSVGRAKNNDRLCSRAVTRDAVLIDDAPSAGRRPCPTARPWPRSSVSPRHDFTGKRLIRGGGSAAPAGFKGARCRVCTQLPSRSGRGSPRAGTSPWRRSSRPAGSPGASRAPPQAWPTATARRSARCPAGIEPTRSTAPALVEITVSLAEAVAAGLACGGTARVLVQPAAAYPAETWSRLVDREPLCLVTPLPAAATEMYTPGEHPRGVPVCRPGAAAVRPRGHRHRRRRR